MLFNDFFRNSQTQARTGFRGLFCTVKRFENTSQVLFGQRLERVCDANFQKILFLVHFHGYGSLFEREFDSIIQNVGERGAKGIFITKNGRIK